MSLPRLSAGPSSASLTAAVAFTRAAFDRGFG